MTTTTLARPADPAAPAAIERQPREHPVPCQRHGRGRVLTWNVSAICDQCEAP